MKIEGYISFRSQFIPNFASKRSLEILSFSKGYVIYPGKQENRKGNFRFCVFANSITELFIASSPELSGDDFHFYDPASSSFNKDYLENLGIGIWYDESAQTIRFYREQFGQVPLFYSFVPNYFLAFSTSLASLQRMPSVRKILTPDQETILQYSQFAADSVRYYSEHTYYDQIKAALPGHITTITPDAVSQQLCIDFNTTKWDSLNSLEEYGEAFSYLFKKSVHNILKNDEESVASHLSGGLDSSSICVTARNLFPEKVLHTLYGLTDIKEDNEIGHSRLVAKKIKSVHHEISASTNYIESMLLYTSMYGHPEIMVLDGTFQGTMMEYSANLGIKTLMNGHPGDSIVGSGLSVLTDAFLQRDWPLMNQLLSKMTLNVNNTAEFKGWTGLSDKKKFRLISSRRLFGLSTAMYKKMSFFSFAALVAELHYSTGLSFGYFIQQTAEAISKKIAGDTSRLLTLANDEYLWNTSPRFSPFSNHRFWAEGIYTSQAIGYNQEAFVLGNHYQMANRFPFYDKELYELSLAVPELIKFDNGRGRGHLREAMKGLLPEEVRGRTDKGQFSIYSNKTVLELVRQSQDFMLPTSEVWHYLDRNKFQVALKTVRDRPEKSGTGATLIRRAIALAVWLYLFRNNGLSDTDVV